MADRIKGITIEIGGDTTGLSKSLSGVNKEIKSTQSQLKDVERLLKLDPSNTELLSQKQRLLTQAVDETKDKLNALKTAEKQVQQQFDDGKITQEQYEGLKREIASTEQQLKSLENQAKESNATLQKISQVGDKFQEVGGKISGAGKKLLPVTAAVGAIGAASVEVSKEIDEGYDTIIKKTGATGDTLEGLKDNMDNVFSSLPVDAETAGAAIGEVNTRFGVTGDKLEDLSTKFIEFARINDADVNQSIQLVSRAMGDAGLKTEDAGAFMDQLTVAAQASGISIETLTENVTKYGAPMRALGMDTKESISIFAAWEKAGVNTETAFAGMKTAIGKWGKEGKDAREEFKKTLKEIEDTPDTAKATTKAIEVFGQKAGPDLADAIKGGRFEYEDFLKALDGSEGIVESTFEDIQHPADEAKVALNNLKLAGADLGDTLLKTLQPIIKSVIEKIKEFTSWFNNLTQSQKETIIKVAAVVAALGPLLVIVGQIATGIGALITTVSTLGAVFSALSVAGGPILLTVAAVAALTAVLINVMGNTKDYRKEAGKLSEQEQQNKDAVDDLYSSYEQMDEQRQNATASAQAEAQHEQALFKELQNITDENGKVKAGYEDRAKFITGELSDALGTEIEMTDNQIQNYKDMAGEIDNLIQKKKANAILDANQQGYTDAIMNQMDAYTDYKQAQEDVEETTRKLEEAQKDATKAMNEPFGLDKYNDAQESITGYSKKLAGLKETLNKAETAYTGYNTTIQNYEGLSSAIISGDQQKITDAILKTSNQFQTVETSTKESLEQQVQTYKEKYQAMKEAVEEGAPGITQAQVDQMKQMVDKSEEELNKLPDVVGNAVLSAEALAKNSADFQKVGSDFAAGMAQGILDGKQGVYTTALEMAEASIKAARTKLDSHSPSRVMDSIGHDFDDGFSNGISDGQSGIVSVVQQIVSAITAPITDLSEKSKTWGADLLDGFIKGIESKASALADSVKGVADTISSYIHFSRPDVGPLREYEKWMPDMLQGLSEGIKNNAWRVTDQLKGLTGNMSYMLGGDASDTSGVDLTKIEGLLNYYLPNMNSGNNIVLDDGMLVGKMMPAIDTNFAGDRDTKGRNGT